MGIHFERGQALFELKRYREAVDAYQAELAEFPESPVVYAALAAALINLREVRDASRAIRCALEFAPDMAYAHYILSVVHQHNGRWDDAEKAIIEAVRLEQSPDYFHQWAALAVQRGKFADALASTGHALSLDPRHSPSLLLHGQLLAREGKLSEAHALYVTALSYNPQNAKAQHALGLLTVHAGDASAALGTLREARRLDPIGANDAGSIALAYGRLIWPLKLIDRLVFRWYLLSAKKRWCLFTALGVLLVLGGRAAGVDTRTDQTGQMWPAICITIANFLALPFSFHQLATAVGYLALRREFHLPWSRLIFRPLVLFPVLVIHLIATFLGGALSIPGLAIVVCLVAVSLQLFTASMQTEASRLTGWVCLPLFALILLFGISGAVILERESAMAGSTVLAIVFAIAFFSDNIIRWTSSWRFRRNTHLFETP